MRQKQMGFSVPKKMTNLKAFLLEKSRVRVLILGIGSGFGNFSRVFRVLKYEIFDPSAIFIAFLCTNIFQTS